MQLINRILGGFTMARTLSFSLKQTNSEQATLHEIPTDTSALIYAMYPGSTDCYSLVPWELLRKNLRLSTTWIGNLLVSLGRLYAKTTTSSQEEMKIIDKD